MQPGVRSEFLLTITNKYLQQRTQQSTQNSRGCVTGDLWAVYQAVVAAKPKFRKPQVFYFTTRKHDLTSNAFLTQIPILSINEVRSGPALVREKWAKFCPIGGQYL